jgi:hypothetical protein
MNPLENLAVCEQIEAAENHYNFKNTHFYIAKIQRNININTSL